MDPIRIGVIGVGLIGKSHLKRYESVPGAHVVAIADIDETEGRRVGALHGIPHVYTDFRKLLERDDIDAVDVCLHNNFHGPVTIEALRAGKHVYCEKPMAGAYADAKAMYDAAQETGKKLHIQIGTLYSTETKVAKRLIEAGRLGKLFHARSTGYRRRGRPFVDGYGAAPFVRKATAGGGALYDMGVYHIAQMLYLLGLPRVDRISGKVYQEMEMDEARRAQSGFDVDELGLGLVKFEGGVTLDIIEAWAIHLDAFEGSYIVGSRGGIRLQPFSYHFIEDDIALAATCDLGAAQQRWQRLNEDETAYESSQHHWVAALQGRVPLLPTADVALETMLVSEGIYLSDRLGREVTADEVVSESKSTSVKV